MKRLELGTKIDATHIPGNLGIGKIVRYLDGGSYDLDIVGEWTEETKFVGPWEENP